MKPPGGARAFPRRPAEAAALQRRLSRRVVVAPLPPVEWIAGVDGVPLGGRARRAVLAAAVLLRRGRCALSLEAVSGREGPCALPYIPGLLSFLEGPAFLAAVEGLPRRPDCLLVDGHGLAHPRRFGIASHLGVLLDLPSVGVAKTILVGTARGRPGARRGSRRLLYDAGEAVGALLRTRTGVSPVVVSVGHRADLPSAVRLVLALARFRLPEPTRLAHIAVGAAARGEGAEAAARAAFVRSERAARPPRPRRGSTPRPEESRS